MLPNGPRESERILRGTRVAWKQMLALTGTQARDGKVGPLQVVVGLGADKGGGGVDQWPAGDSHRENDNDEHWRGSSSNPSCPSRALR